MYVEALTTTPESTDPLWDKLIELNQTPDMLERAELVCQAVHQSVRPISAKVGSISLENSILNDRASNCYGLNSVLSEAYEVTDIPHYVAFTNGHVFLLASDGQTYAHVFDAHIPDFNGNVEVALPKSHLTRIPAQIEQFGRAFVRMHSSNIHANSKLAASFDEISEKNPWVRHKPNYLRDPRNVSDEQEIGEKMLWSSLYEPVTGRRVLSNYNQLRQTTADKNWPIDEGKVDKAFDRLFALRGVYPEIDRRCRDQFNILGKLVMTLAQNERLEEAFEAIDYISSSYEISNDTRLRVWSADQYRKIGTVLGYPELLEEAISRYQAVYEQAPRPLIAQKLAKATRMLEACSSTPIRAIIDAKLPETVAALSA